MPSEQRLRRSAGRMRDLANLLSREADRQTAVDYANELDAAAEILRNGGDEAAKPKP